uniref:OSJNBb0013O03.9 protein n=1 Tax=Oryza sativa subsp. japonica TaxID=39947 RepID=Q7XW10_ORYSJ|nr:OSJNBb0013O03.9 [Oryza sativa Japonica Group]
MAAEKHDARKTTRIVPDIVFLHDIARAKIEEAPRTETNTTVIGITAATATIANSGHQTTLVERISRTVVIMEIGTRKTMVDDDRTLENLNVTLGIAHRSLVYSTVLYAAGADDNALANYLPSALKGSARSWLMHLPPYSISSWADLWQQFVANFQGTYKRHTIEDDLHALTQNYGESLRDYVRRFNECINTIPDITDASMIRAFKTGECLILKKSLERQLALEKGKRVRVVEKATEATTQDSDSAYPDSDLHVSHIFGGSTAYSSKREYKKVEREVCSTWQGAAPKMKWSEQKIEFSDEDHPKAAVILGRNPIVVEPTIRNIKVARVLVDGGSSINLLFASTLDAMGIPLGELTPTDQPFHGITPQSSSKPLGKIMLPVTFGQASNFRTEQITFHVVEFDTAYNAIIGRTALAKFMAASHYAYQVLKMPGPKGTITIQGNAKLAVQCDKPSLDMVEHTPSPPATAEPPKKVVKTTKMPKPDGAIKIVPLSSANPDKTVKIGASLNEK